MWYYDEGTGIVLLIVVLVALVGYLLYQLAIGASYVLVAIFGVLYTIIAVAGSLLLAGLDMLFVPQQLDAYPWAAWAFWGAVTGAAAGFWTVAPVYGLRRVRRAVLWLPLLLIAAVFGVRLLVAPPQFTAPVTQAGGTGAATTSAPLPEWISFAIPVTFDGLTPPKDKETPRQLTVSLGTDQVTCSDANNGPQLGPLRLPDRNYGALPEPTPPLRTTASIALRRYTTAEYTGDLPVLVRFQPTTLGSIGNTVYWTQNSERGGYLVWFLDLDATRVLFTLVVEPNGTYRFVDDAVWGTGAMSGGAREYDIAQRTGVLGLSRRRQRVRVQWQQQGFRREDARAVGQYGLGFGHMTFPEGQLLIDITPAGG